MDLEKLNHSLVRQDVQFDATGIIVSGQHHAYADIVSVHYMKPAKRGALRGGIFAVTVALLVALVAVRLYLFAKVFSKLSLVLKNGETVLVTKKRDMIASDRIYEHLMQHKAKT